MSGLGARTRAYVAGLPEMVEEVVVTLTGPLGVPPRDTEDELFREL